MKQDESKIDVGEFLKIRRKKMSYVFVGILTTTLFLLIPVFFLVLKSYMAGVGVIISFVGALISFVLLLRNKVTIANIIFLSLLIVTIGFSSFGAISDQNEFSVAFIAVLGFSVGIIIPSGLLVNSIFTIIMTIGLSALHSTMILCYGSPELVQRIPLFILTLALAGSTVFYLTRLQDTLLKRSIDENKNRCKSLDKVESIVNNISVLREKTEESQKSMFGNLDTVGNLINSYSENIEDLYKSSLELSDEMSLSQKNLNLLMNEIKNISEKVTDQSALIEQNSAGQEEIFQSITSISSNVKQANDINKELSESAESGKDLISSAISSITELGSYQDQMLNIVGVISNISSQTNLLAMNASIEAAHAGNAGRGFAVVADEIRNLADVSGVKTKEISELIKGMNVKITESVSMVNNVSESLLDITDKVEKSYPVISVISGSMEELITNNRQTLESDKELVSNTASIRESVKKEEAVSEDYKGTFDKLKNYFERLNETVTTLKDYNEKSINIIKNISEIRQESESINNEIETLFKDYNTDSNLNSPKYLKVLPTN